jgi:hypothetical protein
MKKSIFFVVIFVILNGCAQYSALLGPTYTMAKTGNFVHAGSSMMAAYGIKKTTGKLPTEHVNLFVKKHSKINSFFYKQNETRECQTIHTSSLNEIFFDTLDVIDCVQNPFSILR